MQFKQPALLNPPSKQPPKPPPLPTPQEVASMQFNVLLTTYEMVMRDAPRLNKLEWRYIVIDEAQRMKDSKSKLSRDLMKFKVWLLLGGGAGVFTFYRAWFWLLFVSGGCKSRLSRDLRRFKVCFGVGGVFARTETDWVFLVVFWGAVACVCVIAGVCC